MRDLTARALRRVLRALRGERRATSRRRRAIRAQREALHSLLPRCRPRCAMCARRWRGAPRPLAAAVDALRAERRERRPYSRTACRSAPSCATDGVAFRLWAPSRERASVIVDGVEHRMEPRAGRLVRAHRRQARRRHALRVRVSGRRRCASPIRPRAFSRTASHAPSAVVDPRAYRLARDAAGAAARGTRRCCTSCTSERSRRGGTYARRRRAARRAGRARRDGDRADAARAAGRGAQLGLRRRAAVRAAARVRNAGRAQGVRRRGARARPGRAARRRLQPLRARRATTSLSSRRRSSPSGITRRGAPRSTSTASDSATVRELFVQNALYWLTSTASTACGSTRCTRSATIRRAPFLAELAARVRAGVEPGRHVHLVLENDANEAQLLGRLRRAVERRRAPCPPRPDHRRARRILPRLRARAGAPARVARSPKGSRIQGERFGAPRRRRARRAERARCPRPRSSTFCRTTTRSETARSANASRRSRREAAVRAATAVLLLAPAIPLLFMGEEWSASTPFSFFSDFGADLGAAVTDGAAARVRRVAGVQRSRRCASVSPTRRTRATMRASTLRWDERDAPRARGDARRCMRELLALRARPASFRGSRPARTARAISCSRARRCA